MTIDEAIKHCEEVVAECATECKAGHFPQRIIAGKCAEDHRQLAEWLKDFKRLLEQEPCEDCISRHAALDLVADYDLSMGQVVKGIHALPPVTPAEKVGHWYKKPHEICYTCDQCRTTNASGVKYNFCPHCGAKMQEVGE